MRRRWITRLLLGLAILVAGSWLLISERADEVTLEQIEERLARIEEQVAKLDSIVTQIELGYIQPTPALTAQVGSNEE